MFERTIRDTRATVLAALGELRDESNTLTGQHLIDELSFLQSVIRQAQHDSLRTIARLKTEGEFEKRAVRPAAAVADLLCVAPAQARRLVATASAVFPTSLSGESVEPKLPATAMALGGYEIDQAHAEAIDRALNTSAARRIDPQRWAGAEAQLADWARMYSPDQLAHLARQLIDALDQDGPAPDDDYPQLNELHLAKLPDGGGRIRGQLDAPTFEAVARAIRAALTNVSTGTTGSTASTGPGASAASGADKSLGQRQAEALAAICEHTLDDGYLPTEGGQRPHITAILDFDRLTKHARGGLLEFGGHTTAGQLRRILCDSRVTPVVLGGDSAPLDLGRSRRTASPAQRAALSARDGGCAHPGCDKTQSWCSVHHIIHWVDGGRTDLDNLVFLCLQHHIMVHESGWTIRMRQGHPEFIPPKWIDPTQTPRTNRHLTLV